MASVLCGCRVPLHAAVATMAFVLATGFQSVAASLILTNGDFSNVSGLTPAGDWYFGVPDGWNTANSTGVGTPTYSVYAGGGSPNVANLSQLGNLAGGFNPLYQTIGSLDSTGTVTLTFETRNDWTPATPISVGVGIYPASEIGTWGSPFNFATFTTTGSQTLQATGVNAAVPLAVAFWTAGGTPGLDNVVVVPEPSSAMLMLLSAMGLGGFAAFRRRDASINP